MSAEIKKVEVIKTYAGSFTVELACLMPLVLFVVLGVWFFGFYMHHKVWLTAAAYEAALVGTAEGLYEREAAVSAAQLRAKERLADFFGEEDGGLQVQEIGEEIQVTYQGEVQALYGGMAWKFRAKGSSRLCSPPKLIRRIRLGKAAGDAVLSPTS